MEEGGQTKGHTRLAHTYTIPEFGYTSGMQGSLQHQI